VLNTSLVLMHSEFPHPHTRYSSIAWSRSRTAHALATTHLGKLCHELVHIHPSKGLRHCRAGARGHQVGRMKQRFISTVKAAWHRPRNTSKGAAERQKNAWTPVKQGISHKMELSEC